MVDKNEILGYYYDGNVYDIQSAEVSDIKNEIQKHDLKISLHNQSTKIYAKRIIHHSIAHVMANAVQNLYPDAKLGFSSEDHEGFHYDFYNIAPVNNKILRAIEAEMLSIINHGYEITKHTLNNDIITQLKARNEHIKLTLISDLQSQNQHITYYKHGNWLDICMGPHVTNTKQIGEFFELTNSAEVSINHNGEKIKAQRINGICRATKKEIEEYKSNKKALKDQDHKTLGRKMELFHFQADAHGDVFWWPNGTTTFNQLKAIIRKSRENVFEEINTPQILSKTLWEQSGHMANFAENMFDINEHSTLRPMNCPGSIQIFNAQNYSYKQLPVRLSEFGRVFRNEPSGALSGLMRAQSFTQDDAHIYCLKEHIISECTYLIQEIKTIYESFNLSVSIQLAGMPEKHIGDESIWQESISLLKQALNKNNNIYTTTNDGAFYGPKIEFHAMDNANRLWQCGTIQLDFSMPKKLNAIYIDQEGNKQHPIMIHTAYLGSLERFLGILLEHYKGKLPPSIAPIHCAVLSVSNKHVEYAKKAANTLQSYGIRVKLDIDDKTINNKIQHCLLRKIQWICCIGEREEQSNAISFRQTFNKAVTFTLQLEQEQNIINKIYEY